MAIGRVSGPMLLADLDRQGLDLNFVSTSINLVKFDFSDYRVAVRGGTISPYVFDVAGNAAIGNVILERGAVVTTQELNQNLTLQANGVANVTVINANVISGRVDGTVIGGLVPSLGTFSYLDATTLGTFALANVSNLKADRVVFTSSDNTHLTDNGTFKFIDANNALIVANLTVTELQTFTTLDAANLVLRSFNPTSVPYTAANNWVVTTPDFTFYHTNSTVRTGNVNLTGGTPNQVLYLDPVDNKVASTSYLTYDGTNMRANGVTRLGNVSILISAGDPTITTTGTNEDLVISPSGTGVISVNDHNIRDLAVPTQPSDAATKAYVDAAIVISTASTSTIYQFDTKVQVQDNNLNSANIIFVVDGVENGRIENGLVNWQDIIINDATISTQAGPLLFEPYNNDRVQFVTPSAVTLPTGSASQRPTPGLENTGDFRFNTELGTVEWFDGTQWENPTTNIVTSQTIVPDGINASFTLDRETTTDGILVNFNGVIQRPSTTYSVAGDVITFSTVPITTDIIEIRFFNGTVAQATNPIVVDSSYANIGTTTTTIDSWYTNEYRAVKYTYTAKSVIADHYEMGDLRVVHDNLESFYDATFVSKSGNTAITWSTLNNPLGVMNIQATGAYSDIRIKFHAIYLTEPVT